MKTHLLEVSLFSTPIGIAILAISFIVAVYLTRWIFGIDRIIENQNKTNLLLKEILSKASSTENNKTFDSESKNLGDVNNPNELKNIIDNLK